MKDLNPEFLYSLGQSELGPKESYDYFLMGAEFGVKAALEMILAIDETRECIANKIRERFGIAPEPKPDAKNHGSCPNCGGLGYTQDITRNPYYGDQVDRVECEECTTEVS